MQDKVAVVTGGSSGIGKAVALELANAGAKVLITGRNLEKLKAAAAESEDIDILVADSRSASSARKIVAKVISLWGRLDVLVNNAGAGAPAPLETVDEEKIDEIFSTNVVASSLLAAAAVPYLRSTKGVILNVTSTIGHKPSAGFSHYGASKAALDYLTRTWALELAPDVRVNAVSPGPTETGALTGMMGFSEEQAQAIREQEESAIPLQRRGSPSDVSQAVFFLVQPSSQWITGQILGVDGGFGV